MKERGYRIIRDRCGKHELRMAEIIEDLPAPNYGKLAFKQDTTELGKAGVGMPSITDTYTYRNACTSDNMADLCPSCAKSLSDWWDNPVEECHS